MKVHQIIHEQDVVSGAINSLSNAIQSVVGSQSTSAPAQSNGQQPTSGSANEAINAVVQQLYPRIDRAVQSRDRNALTSLLSRGPQFVLQQLENANNISGHLTDRVEDAVQRRILSRMAQQAFDGNMRGGSRRTDWVALGRNDPRMFIELVVDPSRMSEFGL